MMKTDFEKFIAARDEFVSALKTHLVPKVERALNAIDRAVNMLVVRCGGTHPVRSMQAVLDYPKPGPRVSRFTGIAKFRRAARQRKAAK